MFLSNTGILPHRPPLRNTQSVFYLVILRLASGARSMRRLPRVLPMAGECCNWLTRTWTRDSFALWLGEKMWVG